MTILTRRNLIIGAVAVTGVAAAGYYATLEDAGTATYFAKDGVALRGADPVAFFTQSKAVIGSAEHSYDWRGVTWYFASAEHKDMFADAPETYAPQYGGYCAWAVAAKQKLFSIQPENWTVVDGKLYLNFSNSVQEKWEADRDGFIDKADDLWPKVREKLS